MSDVANTNIVDNVMNTSITIRELACRNFAHKNHEEILRDKIQRAFDQAVKLLQESPADLSEKDQRDTLRLFFRTSDCDNALLETIIDIVWEKAKGYADQNGGA